MSRFRIPGGIGYQGHYPLGSIKDGTLALTNSSSPASFQDSFVNGWNDLTHEARSKVASAGVDVNRLMAVVKAVNRARFKVAPMLVAELGVRVEELIAGVIPGLLIMLCCVVSTTALGAAAGGALGFLLGGVGAAPGAVIGGTLGLEAGIALLTWMGLAFLVAHVGKDLGVAITKAIDGLRSAWDAGRLSGAGLELRIDFAATQLASAVVHLFLGIVNGLIAYVTKGAGTSSVNNLKTAISEASVADAVAKINKCKILGKTVAVWFEKNYKAIIEFRSRKKARPSDSPKPPEPVLTPSQLKKVKDEHPGQERGIKPTKLLSLEEVTPIVRNAAREELKALRAAGASNNTLGPAISVAIDRSTGKVSKVFLNDADGLTPKLHKTLSDNLFAALELPYNRTAGAGSHSEIYAVNELLVNGAKLENIAVYTEQIGGKFATTVKPPCPHCSLLLEGVFYVK
jgi:hypothetical protein